MKSIVEAIKLLIKFAISLCWFALFSASSIFAYAYVKEATSSRLIALFVGLLVGFLLFTVGEKIVKKLPEFTLLKAGGKDDYERASFRSTWAEIIGFGFLWLLYGLCIMAICSLVLPGSLMQSIFHWSLYDSRPANGWSILRLIGVGALAGILTNSDMRATVKHWFR